MTKNIFMSYSRRELGFVDQLANKLEAEGYTLWLDYRSLVPGVPWDQQIDQGLSDSDTVLLVVSKASMTSAYVEAEWRHFLQTNKRIILLIFEAVKLPSELENCDWVDFRGGFTTGLKELFSKLKQPVPEKSRAPQKGFKAPFIVWIAALLAAIAGTFALLFAVWSIFIPWFLVPLPYQILKRSFNFLQVQTAFIALPFALAIYAQFRGLDGQGATTTAFFWVLTMLIVLRSGAMQRWVKPEAAIPKYIKPVKLKITNPTPVSFCVDHAVEDRVIAEDMTAVLKKYGHLQAQNIQSAKAVFVLVSRFKADTEADPDHQEVFPVMIQSTKNIAPKLSRIQWIDFRPGVRGLDVIAQLLPDPVELLKKLGARPVSAQMVYPPIITAIYYCLVFLVVITVAGAADYLFSANVKSISAASRLSTFREFGILLLAFVGLVYWIVRSVLARKGIFSSVYSFAAGIAALGLLIFWQALIITRNEGELQSIGGLLEGSLGGGSTGLYLFGVLIMAVIIFINRRDVRRWFPAKRT